MALKEKPKDVAFKDIREEIPVHTVYNGYSFDRWNFAHEDFNLFIQTREITLALDLWGINRKKDKTTNT